MRWHELLVTAFSRRQMLGWLVRCSPLSGASPQENLEQRVLAQGVRIVLVLVAASYLENTLLDEGS